MNEKKNLFREIKKSPPSGRDYMNYLDRYKKGNDL